MVDRDRDNLYDKLLNMEIYAWTKKRWVNKNGLINTIGVNECPANGMPLELSYKIWNTKAFVDGIELYMELSRVYITFVANFLISHKRITMRFGIWIKVPDDKKKYLNLLNNNVNIISNNNSNNNSNSINNSNMDRKRKYNNDLDDKIKNNDKKQSSSNGSSSSSSSSSSIIDNNDDNNKDKIGEYKLLLPRTLLDLLHITEIDPYVQLGDLYFE